MGDWFARLFGFKEGRSEADYEKTRANFKLTALDDGLGFKLTSSCNGREFVAGNFETPSLEELRDRVDLSEARKALSREGRTLSVEEIIGDVSELHVLPANAYAMFQCASQFNCLEHTSQMGLPEHGISIYSSDKTQGPACATACAPGTVYRNYFAFQTEGQTKKRQVLNLEDIDKALENKNRYFQVQSGYTLATESSLRMLAQKLGDHPSLQETVRQKLRIGMQWDTEVTGYGFGRFQYEGDRQLVSQAYCSAISVSYSRCSANAWAPFATLILQAAYEATMYCAVENALRHPDEPGARRIFLTALGGGVFGNNMQWIRKAMLEAFTKFKDIDLEVYIVSFGRAEPEFRGFDMEFNGKPMR